MSDDALSVTLGALIRLEAKTNRIDENTDWIEEQLGGVRDDIGVNMARADRVGKAAENTREKVTLIATELARMWRKINRLEEAVLGLSGRASGDDAKES